MLKVLGAALVAAVVLAGCTFGPDPLRDLPSGGGAGNGSGPAGHANATVALAAPSVMLEASPSGGMVPLPVEFTLRAQLPPGAGAPSWTLVLGDGSEPVEGGQLPAHLEHRYEAAG